MSRENVLKGCLVESDPAAIARARQAKRRALVVAIILQVLLVGLLVLAPLLGAMEKLPQTIRVYTPTPPYKGDPRPSGTTRDKPQTTHRRPLAENQPPIFEPPRIPSDVANINDVPELFENFAENSGEGARKGDPNGILVDPNSPSDRSTAVPKPPETAKPKPTGPIRVSTNVQEARLLHRAVPQYPLMLRNARMEGKVVLRAVIAKDGTIQSLEAVSGNILFVEAALEAIRQWRYLPTLLNGEAVEVETVITVVFTLKR